MVRIAVVQSFSQLNVRNLGWLRRFLAHQLVEETFFADSLELFSLLHFFDTLLTFFQMDLLVLFEVFSSELFGPDRSAFHFSFCELVALHDFV